LALPRNIYIPPTYKFSFTVNHLEDGQGFAFTRVSAGVNLMPESKTSDWRELCAAAVKEQDAERLISLVDQIIAALDQAHLPSQSGGLERRVS
jgi:putative NADH-flavin reductase